MIISLIAAVSNNNAIGFNNQLLWHLPNDLKFFKNTTWAAPVVMGRKTFESLGGGKALQGRLNIIVTNNKNYIAENATVVHSLEEAIAVVASLHYNELFIIGGGELYRQSILIANKIYLTRVDAIMEADTFFPTINLLEWHQVYAENHLADTKHVYNYSFQLWKRK
jgi:dihydrofolate reductase